MKKIICLFIVLILVMSVMVGCTKNASLESSVAEKNDTEKLDIVVTTFPAYDWLREILGEKIENVNLTLLLDNGVDLHNYQPTVDDIIKISNCHMFIYVGGESDHWVEDILETAKNPNMITINLVESLGDLVKVEEIVEGMEHEHEEEHHEDEEHEEDEEDHHKSVDEHVWLSLKNAKVLSSLIAEKLSQLDEANAEIYDDNLQLYIEKLDKLDDSYATMIENAPNKVLVFGDRFPFRYLIDDYGLKYYAAFTGCSAETEASFQTISFLSDKLNEVNVPVVLRIEGSNHKIAETIVSNSNNKNQQILVLDSMQSITSTDVDNGVTYIDIMEKNLEVFKIALR